MHTLNTKLSIPADSIQGILDFLPYPFLISELKNTVYTNLYINPQFIKEFGYTLNDIPTINDWFNLAYPDTAYRNQVQTDWESEVQSASDRGEQSVTRTARIYTKENGYKWFEVKASVFVRGFQFVSFINVDEVVNQGASLRMANENQNKMLSILSHDLRNAMSNLHSVASLSLHKQISEEEFQMLAEKVKEKSLQTIQLLDTTVQWTKSNFDAIKITLEPTDCQEIISSILLTDESYKRKEIKININLADIKPITDKEILTVVLRNLISNAIKFTPTEGSILITSAVADGVFKLSVADTGKGMTAERVQSILRNQYSSAPGTENEKGSGIGLSLCQDLLKKIKGHLEIISSPGIGSDMKIVLNI